MEINLSQTMKQLITILLLVILPMITIIIGLASNVLNAWFYILAITWFGIGIIFFGVTQ